MPHGLEDVIFKNIEDQITVNIGKNASFCNGFASEFTLDFHFEVSRKPFDGTMKDIMENKPPKVSNEEIEINMNADLGKYTQARGFTFSKVLVDDALRRRVKITVQNIHWTEEEIMRRMGGYII